MTFAAIFVIIVGLGMIGQWTASALNGQIPELASEPIRIAFHLAAELITALALIAAGIALLTSQSWAITLFLVALGMLFYTCIVSPGYFAQKGQWAWLVMFGLIILLGIVSILLVV